MQQNWKDLLQPSTIRTRTAISVKDYRNPFEQDYGRIVPSSSFRRLQDKAQVFPLDKGDFIRTRLTHSIEVSSIARSIGLSAEKLLVKAGYHDAGLIPGAISSILASAGLVHDLGNPPFGHFGEDIIQEFFQKFFKNNNSIASTLSNEERKDFEHFDGNVQSLRILTKLHFLKDEFGYNLNLPVLASIIKYPRSSSEGNKKEDNRASFKKFGYFQSEKEVFDIINEHLNLLGHRHPITFLLEAADDIAFSMADIEDGCKKGILDFDKIVSIFDKSEISFPDNKIHKDNFIDIYNNFKKEYPTHPNHLDNAVQLFRIYAQGIMINAALDVFITKQDDILCGHFDDDLVMCSTAKGLRKAFKMMMYPLFDSREVLSMEVVGYQAMKHMLSSFVGSVTSDDYKNSKTINGKLYNLISDNFRFIYNHYSNGNESVYNRLLLVTDYISGMTDSYALDVYHRISGQKI